MPALLRLCVLSALSLPFLLSPAVLATPSNAASIPFNPNSAIPPVPIVGNQLQSATKSIPSLNRRSGTVPAPPGGKSVPVPVAGGNVPVLLGRRETNAQRMKRGLGPKKPNYAYPKRALHPRASPAPCTNPTGYVRAVYFDGQGKEVDGYIGFAPNDFGEYPFTPTRTNALRVQLNNCGANGGPFDISSLNGIPNEPFLGLIDGFSNETPTLGPGSFNYAYIGGTSQTPPGSVPLVQSNSFTDATNLPEAVESAVWELGQGNVLTAAWVNPDNSIPPEVLLYVPSAGTFTVTGDLAEFRDTFGPAYPITFSFVPA
ncbi:hypothetical protein EIP91_004194 [Steccherinum ochraceum]|uniref:Uncharacterized protein n=1 Tax=Steccherinum ochraceum TaxID=92696 RepID=A0A4R0RCD2_9APHY|nr:hypothetical protein EIP91_004194 [Steccherinum ochraceum]